MAFVTTQVPVVTRTDIVDEYNSFWFQNYSYSYYEINETINIGVAVDRIRLILSSHPRRVSDTDGSWENNPEPILNYDYVGRPGPFVPSAQPTPTDIGGGQWALEIDLVAETGSAQEVTNITVTAFNIQDEAPSEPVMIIEVQHEGEPAPPPAPECFWTNYNDTIEDCSAGGGGGALQLSVIQAQATDSTHSFVDSVTRFYRGVAYTYDGATREAAGDYESLIGFAVLPPAFNSPVEVGDQPLLISEEVTDATILYDVQNGFGFGTPALDSPEFLDFLIAVDAGAGTTGSLVSITQLDSGADGNVYGRPTITEQSPGLMRVRMPCNSAAITDGLSGPDLFRTAKGLLLGPNDPVMGLIAWQNLPGLRPSGQDGYESLTNMTIEFTSSDSRTGTVNLTIIFGASPTIGG